MVDMGIVEAQEVTLDCKSSVSSPRIAIVLGGAIALIILQGTAERTACAIYVWENPLYRYFRQKSRSRPTLGLT